MPTISQGLGKLVFTNKTFYWVRISRRTTDSLIKYFGSYVDFHYMKIYEFHGSGKPKYHPSRQCGKQLGYIYKNKKTEQLEYVSL